MFKLRLSSFSVVVLMLGASSVNAETLRDPTRPLQYQAASKQLPTLVLQAIYNKADGNAAVINGKLVKAGQRIDSYKVLRITESKVYYEGHGGTRVLALRQNIFDKN